MCDFEQDAFLQHVLMMLEFWRVCVCLSDSVLRCMVLRSWIGLFQRFVAVLLGPAATARASSPPRRCSLCARRPLVVLTAHHCCHPPCARAPAPSPGNATTTPTQNRCRHRGQTETPTGHTHTHTHTVPCSSADCSFARVGMRQGQIRTQLA